jgi:hypothetical protein
MTTTSNPSTQHATRLQQGADGKRRILTEQELREQSLRKEWSPTSKIFDSRGRVRGIVIA